MTYPGEIDAVLITKRKTDAMLGVRRRKLSNPQECPELRVRFQANYQRSIKHHSFMFTKTIYRSCQSMIYPHTDHRSTGCLS